MNKILKYKGYQGSIEPDLENDVLYGKVLFVKDLITYEADSIKGIKEAFEVAIDDYLETCEALDKQPDQSFSGSFNVRVGPHLHRKAVIAAYRQDIKLNVLVRQALEEKLTAPNQLHVTIVSSHVIEKEALFESEREELRAWETKPQLLVLTH